MLSEAFAVVIFITNILSAPQQLRLNPKANVLHIFKDDFV